MIRRAAIAFALAQPFPAAAQAEISGMPDPPGTGSRFPGAAMIHYEQRPAEAFVVPTGPAARDQKQEVVDGKLTLAIYRVNEKRSPLEVADAYESAFRENGFEILFRCAEAGCGGARFNAAVVPSDRRFLAREAQQQYIAARRKQESGDLIAQLYALRGSTGDVYFRHFVIEERDTARRRP